MNQATIDLIKHFESLHDGDLKKIGLQPKMDAVQIWTEGWGRAMIDPTTKDFLRGVGATGKALKYQTIHTVQEAEVALKEDLKKYSSFAMGALGTVVWDRLNENQKGAITSFIYNCGVGKPPYKIWKNIPAFLNDCMTKKELVDYWGTSVIKSKGNILRGLVLRREAESKLFFA